MPRVSIITPVYNAARFLPKTLDSVRAQTLTDWEQILVDDGSTDDSVAIIEAAAKEDNRFRLIRTPRNGGPSKARNLAIDAARGRFLAFLDSDDLWLVNKLERSVSWLEEHESYAFAYHDYRHISRDSTMVGRLIQAPEVLDWRTLHVRRGHGGCMSIVIDRTRAVKFRFPSNHEYLHEDFCAWMCLIQQGHLGGRVPEQLGYYRVSSRSRSGNKWKGTIHTWKIYRKYSKLPLMQATLWWTEYVWNSHWLYRFAAPLYPFTDEPIRLP